MAEKKPTWRFVKSVIRDFDPEELVDLIQDLYRLNASNADYLHTRLLSDLAGDLALSPYKKRIKEAICPAQPWKTVVKLREGRKAISDFRKASDDVRGALVLMAYYIECGNDFTLDFGDMDGVFYDSLCSMLDQLVKLLISTNDHRLACKFVPALEREFSRIDGKMGWGYPDEFDEQLTVLRKHFG